MRINIGSSIGDIEKMRTRRFLMRVKRVALNSLAGLAFSALCAIAGSFYGIALGVVLYYPLLALSVERPFLLCTIFGTACGFAGFVLRIGESAPSSWFTFSLISDETEE
jgi:hypothetical protein